MDKKKEQIQVTEILETKSGTSKNTGKPYTIYGFKAMVGDKELKFKTMSKSISEVLAKDLKAEVEFEESEREYDGEVYKERNVSQMWVDGKPVRSEGGGKGWQPRQDSPETRKSIEQQTVANQIKDEIIDGKEPPPADLLAAYRAYQRDKMADYLKPAATGGKPKAEKDAATQIATTLPDFANPTEFVMYCQKQFGISATQILNELNVQKATEIKNYKASYQALQAVRG